MAYRFRFIVFLALFVLSACRMDNCTNPLDPSSSSTLNSGLEIWMAPNIGSPDYLDLFRSEMADQWSSARDLLTGFQFYGGNMSTEDCGLCDKNLYNKFIELNAMGQLTRVWKKGIGFEGGALKSFGGKCPPPSVFINQAMNFLGQAESNGGRVNYISMDWPIDGGDTCGLTRDETILRIGEYINGVHQAYPHVQIGLIDGYPGHTPEDVESIIDTFIRNKVPLPFIHMDWDRWAVQRPGFAEEYKNGSNPDVDLPRIRDYVRGRGIKFGVVIWPGYGNSSEGAVADMVHASNIVRAALGNNLDRIVFQSWAAVGDATPPTSGPDIRRYPLNLPETKEGTMTSIVNTEGRKFR